MTLYIMCDKELARLEVLRDLTSGRLTVSTAAELLGLESLVGDDGIEPPTYSV